MVQRSNVLTSLLSMTLLGSVPHQNTTWSPQSPSLCLPYIHNQRPRGRNLHHLWALTPLVHTSLCLVCESQYVPATSCPKCISPHYIKVALRKTKSSSTTTTQIKIKKEKHAKTKTSQKKKKTITKNTQKTHHQKPHHQKTQLPCFKKKKLLPPLSYPQVASSPSAAEEFYLPVRSKGNSNSSKGSPKSTNGLNLVYREDFWWLDKTQPSSGTYEPGSHLPKEVISLITSPRDKWALWCLSAHQIACWPPGSFSSSSTSYTFKVHAS